VCRKVLDGRQLLGRAKSAAGLGHLQLGKRRQIRRDGIAQEHAAFLDQQHDGGRGHRLGHGGDREDRIGLERLLGGSIAIADRLEMGELARAHDAEHGAGELACIDLAAQRLADATQSGRGEADGLRLCAGKGGCRHGRASRRSKAAMSIVWDARTGKDIAAPGSGSV